MQLNKKTVCELNGRYYLVSTVELDSRFCMFGLNYETMVFICDKNGNVKNWTEKYCRKHKNLLQATNGHHHTVRDIEKILGGKQL